MVAGNVCHHLFLSSLDFDYTVVDRSSDMINKCTDEPIPECFNMWKPKKEGPSYTSMYMQEIY